MIIVVKMVLNNVLKNDEIFCQIFYFFFLCVLEFFLIEVVVSFVKVCIVIFMKEIYERLMKEFIKVKILKFFLIICLCGDDKVLEYFKMY